MLATFSNKLSQMENVLKEHNRALMELKTLLQLDTEAGGSTSAGGGGMIVVHRPDATQTRHSTRLLAVRRLLTELQQRADHADQQLGKLARKLEKHDAEIAELRSKIIWTHAELPASSVNHNQTSTTVPQTPLPGILPIDVTRYLTTSVFGFYPRDAMLARVFAIATCPSVRLSVRPSVTRRYCA